jgi:NAD+ synthase (glutamine-hydrolysing)
VPDIRLAVAQTNPIVGDFSGNREQIERAMLKASGVDILLFGELALTGYPLADYSYRADVLASTELELAKLVKFSAQDQLHKTTFVVGHVSAADARPDSQQSYALAHNTATVFRGGVELGRYHKQKLPNYDVFDDWRNFVPGNKELVFQLGKTRCAVKICEDIWSSDSKTVLGDEPGLVLVLNGSPFTREKFAQRRQAAIRFAAGNDLLYANLVGGQDELVFDGDSFFVSGGREVFRANNEPGVFEVNHGPETQDSGFTLAEPDHWRRLFDVLVVGLRDYVLKTKQQKIVLGLSGGIDSAMCAVIAVEALGAQNVLGVGLPSRFSSEHSLTDARLLAKNLGIHYRELPIEPAHAAFEQMVSLPGLAGENVQARIRAVTLMAISNAEGHLLLSTGNKSEVAVGYSTIYGDSAGGFAPIKDVYKTDVWALARWFNAQARVSIIPESSINKPPSAELRPDQTDQDSLPDYSLLDALLQQLIEGGSGVPELIASGYEPELVRRIDELVRKAEWKRSQGAIGTKTTSVAFGRGRRVPLTTQFGDLA